MAYANIEDVAARMLRTMTTEEEAACLVYLDDVALLIDSINKDASDEIKNMVSCRAIVRMLGSGDSLGVPVGSSQGSMSALGYAQSWTIGSGGAAGELYLSKAEKRLLGASSRVGSYSPVQELAAESGV